MGIPKPPTPIERIEIEALQQEMAALQLEELRYKVEDMRKAAQARQEAVKRREEGLRNLENDKRITLSRQSACNHRCGGSGMDAVNGQGTDSNYAVIKHRMPWGAVMVMCLRCQKQWLPGDSDYTTALSFPTFNKMSASSQFMFSERVNPDVHLYRDEANVNA